MRPERILMAARALAERRTPLRSAAGTAAGSTKKSTETAPSPAEGEVEGSPRVVELNAPTGAAPAARQVSSKHVV